MRWRVGAYSRVGKVKLSILMALVVILPISALMVAVLRTNVSSSVMDTGNSTQYYWEDKDNTRVTYEDILGIANSISNLRQNVIQEDYEEQIFGSVATRVNGIDSEVYKYVKDDNVVDFYNYQTEQVIPDLREHKETLEEYFAEDSQALEFLNHFVFEPVEGFEMPDTGSSVGSSRAIATIPGLSYGAWNTMNIAFRIAVGIVRAAGWLVPAFITAALVLAALAVITIVVIANWSVISSHFNKLVNSFVDGLGKVGNAVRDFFNRLQRDANKANEIIFNGVKYIVTVVTKLLIDQLAKDAYFIVLGYKDGKIALGGLPITRDYAVTIMGYTGALDQTTNGEGILDQKKFGVSVYTFYHYNARDITREAANGYTPILDPPHNPRPGSGYYWHYHHGINYGLYKKAKLPHAFFGYPS